jgi:hypothetical protein
MDKLLVALCVFVFGSALTLAQSPATQPLPSDITLIPLSKLDADRAYAARAAAKAKWDKMTPEEQAAVRRRGMAKKSREELTAMESLAIGDSTMPPSKALVTPDQRHQGGERAIPRALPTRAPRDSGELEPLNAQLVAR